MTCYAVVIQIGSVILGWHYAVDGYVGALLTVLCWSAAGALVRDPAVTAAPSRRGELGPLAQHASTTARPRRARELVLKVECGVEEHSLTIDRQQPSLLGRFIVIPLDAPHVPFWSLVLRRFPAHSDEWMRAGNRGAISSTDMSVATFYELLMEALRRLDLSVRISSKPSELVDPIPFAQDAVLGSSHAPETDGVLSLDCKYQGGEYERRNHQDQQRR